MTETAVEAAGQLPPAERPRIGVIVVGGTLGGLVLGALTAGGWIVIGFSLAEPGSWDGAVVAAAAVIGAFVGGVIGSVLGALSGVAGVLLRIPVLRSRRTSRYQALAVGLGGGLVAFLGGLLVAPLLGWVPWLTAVAFALAGGGLLGLLAFIDGRRAGRGEKLPAPLASSRKA